MATITCPQSGSVYEITSSKIITRDIDSIGCDVRDFTLKQWSGSTIYASKLIKRGEWPKKDSTQI